MEHIPFAGPDLHAKRNRPKTVKLSAHTRKDPLGFFADTKRQYPSLAEFSNRKLAGIFKVIGETFANEVLTNRQGIKLPGGLGGVVICLSKPSEKTRLYNIDFNTSKQLGFKVPYSNGLTDGNIAKIYYTANVHGGKFKEKYQCSFQPCRKLQRAVSAVMKTELGYKNYLFKSKKQNVASLFHKTKPGKPTWRQKKAINEEKNRQRYLREEYNEFDFTD